MLCGCHTLPYLIRVKFPRSSLPGLILPRILNARCATYSQVNEDDELALLTTHETYTAAQSELESGAFRIMDGTEDDVDDDSPKEASEENNENCNTENVDKMDEVPRKRRKLSPIVYNRSHSPSPTRLKSSASLLPTLPTKCMYQDRVVSRSSYRPSS